MVLGAPCLRYMRSERRDSGEAANIGHIAYPADRLARLMASACMHACSYTCMVEHTLHYRSLNVYAIDTLSFVFTHMFC